MRFSGPLLLALALTGGFPQPTSLIAAQADVTTADIQRLQDNIYDVSRDIAQARTRDASLASQLQAELDDARDEATYLKVKLRKHEPIARYEYSDLRDRIENIRTRARSDSVGGYTPPPGSPAHDHTTSPTDTAGREAHPHEVPLGPDVEDRLQTPLRYPRAQG